MLKLERAVEEKTGVPTYVMPGPTPPSRDAADDGNRKLGAVAAARQRGLRSRRATPAPALGSATDTDTDTDAIVTLPRQPPARPPPRLRPRQFRRRLQSTPSDPPRPLLAQRPAKATPTPPEPVTKTPLPAPPTTAMAMTASDNAASGAAAPMQRRQLRTGIVYRPARCRSNSARQRFGLGRPRLLREAPS